MQFKYSQQICLTAVHLLQNVVHWSPRPFKSKAYKFSDEGADEIINKGMDYSFGLRLLYVILSTLVTLSVTGLSYKTLVNFRRLSQQQSTDNEESYIIPWKVRAPALCAMSLRYVSVVHWYEIGEERGKERILFLKKTVGKSLFFIFFLCLLSFFTPWISIERKKEKQANEINK
ncbi:hypothetical protein RFI_20995 [Reticulomyxa filosa]|uniref:Uncharacterized protein n=1 Tax=Reticulomyxa filosa TaxID=46433 RepID=X6MRV2_RETFI|nr:hypothetical protein RFI_20995 [Reticulomyxa filosa]|eukprot:ETO16361.1 hypothetical protein RFI_20995 [Reticulomyxa filosa]